MARNDDQIIGRDASRRSGQLGGRRPPGPKGLPLLGNLLDFSRDVLRYYGEWSREYGDVVALRLGAWPAVLLNHSDHAEHLASASAIGSP